MKFHVGDLVRVKATSDIIVAPLAKDTVWRVIGLDRGYVVVPENATTPRRVFRTNSLELVEAYKGE